MGKFAKKIHNSRLYNGVNVLDEMLDYFEKHSTKHISDLYALSKATHIPVVFLGTYTPENMFRDWTEISDEDYKDKLEPQAKMVLPKLVDVYKKCKKGYTRSSIGGPKAKRFLDRSKDGPEKKLHDPFPITFTKFEYYKSFSNFCYAIEAMILWAFEDKDTYNERVKKIGEAVDRYYSIKDNHSSWYSAALPLFTFMQFIKHELVEMTVKDHEYMSIELFDTLYMADMCLIDELMGHSKEEITDTAKIFGYCFGLNYQYLYGEIPDLYLFKNITGVNFMGTFRYTYLFDLLEKELKKDEKDEDTIGKIWQFIFIDGYDESLEDFVTNYGDKNLNYKFVLGRYVSYYTDKKEYLTPIEFKKKLNILDFSEYGNDNIKSDMKEATDIANKIIKETKEEVITE